MGRDADLVPVRPGHDLTSCDRQGASSRRSTVNQDSRGADFVSADRNLTSVGRYCWTAHFEPDAATEAAGVIPREDDGDERVLHRRSGDAALLERPGGLEPGRPGRSSHGNRVPGGHRDPARHRRRRHGLPGPSSDRRRPAAGMITFTLVKSDDSHDACQKLTTPTRKTRRLAGQRRRHLRARLVHTGTRRGITNGSRATTVARRTRTGPTTTPLW